MACAAYRLSDLIEACRAGQAGTSTGAQQTAREEFNLATKAEVLAFIANGGLESPVYENTAKWEHNPDPLVPIYVDSYEFTSGKKKGYIAFLLPVTKIWMIKSFKLNSSSPLTFSPFSKIHDAITKGSK
ncbi:MAG: hypothetical protein ABSC94_30535 [Polyangiaceae bacterium]